MVATYYNYSYDSKEYPPVPVWLPSIPIPREVNECRIPGRRLETTVMMMMPLLLVKSLSSSSLWLALPVLLVRDPMFHEVLSLETSIGVPNRWHGIRSIQ